VMKKGWRWARCRRQEPPGSGRATDEEEGRR
jgi:hypothetical protein